MIIKDYQPVRFEEEAVLCKCDSKNSQIVQDGDITQFQATMQVCNFAEDLIINGDFDLNVESNGWILTNFSFTSDSTISISGSSGILETNREIMGINISYQLEIDLTTNQGVPIVIFFGTTKIAEIRDTGKFQLSGICNSNATAGSLKILSPVSNTVAIERIALYPLESDIGLAISSVNADGSTTNIHFRDLLVDISDVTYTFFNVDRDVITVSFSWDFITDAVNGLGLERGCYRLGILSKCANNGGALGVFDSEMVMPIAGLKTALDDETFPYRCDTINAVEVLENTGLMKYMLGGGAEVIVTDINCVPIVGVTYSISLNISLITVGIGYVEIHLGGDISAKFQAVGTHSFELTAINTDQLEIRFADPSSNDIDLTFFRMSYKNTVDDLALLDVDFTSNVFDFKVDHPCTVLIAAVNNEDAYGHRFESSFYTPKARMRGTLRADHYENETRSHIDALNNKIIDFFEERKIVSLRVQNVPQYLTDWLSLWRGFNKVYVNSIEYVVESDIDVVWNRFCDMSKVEVQMGEIRQNLQNINRKGLFAITDINNILLRVFNQEETIIFLDGEEIQLKG